MNRVLNKETAIQQGLPFSLSKSSGTEEYGPAAAARRIQEKSDYRMVQEWLDHKF